MCVYVFVAPFINITEKNNLIDEKGNWNFLYVQRASSIPLTIPYRTGITGKVCAVCGRNNKNNFDSYPHKLSHSVGI